MLFLPGYIKAQEIETTGWRDLSESRLQGFRICSQPELPKYPLIEPLWSVIVSI